jgi:TPR repeat protein
MPRDPARAVAILKKGCEGGDGESCAGLAYCYARGEGVPQDMAKAGELAKTACAAGHRRSCSPANLTPEMAKEEVAAAEKGCDDGLAAACGEAGVILVHQSSYDGAAGLFKRGCEGGDPASCAQLATAHLLGRGVTHDDARARELYRKACDAGEASACEALTLTK